MYVHQSKKTRSQKKFSEDLSSVDNNTAYHFIFGDPNFGDFLMEYNWEQRVDSESTTRDMASPKLGLGVGLGGGDVKKSKFLRMT